MAIETVIDYFKALNAQDKIITFDVSSATVELAAKALGCEGAHIAKSMAFITDGGPVIVVTAGDMKIDNPKFKAQFHQKAKMIAPPDLPALIGHEMGGVCPFAVNDGVKTYLDLSLKRFDIVYPAAGNAASAIKLTIPELESFSGFIEWVDVCKPYE